MDLNDWYDKQANKSVILLAGDRMSCAQFHQEIQNCYLELIVSVEEAFKKKTEKTCIIMGKVIRLQTKISNELRNDIKKASTPATFIIMKEVIVSNGTAVYGKLYKIKFSGEIAQEFLEADIRAGDRIAIKNLAAIEKNTEYHPSTRVSALTPIVLDGNETTIVIGKKVLGERRCNTPGSEDQAFISSRRNYRTEIEEHDSRLIDKSADLSSNANKKRRFNNVSNNSSNLASSHNSQNKTPIKNKKRRVASPPKSPYIHVALEEDADIEDGGNPSLAKHCGAVKYTKLKDINQTHVNSRLDLFGIVIDVLQSQENGRKKKMLRCKIIDLSIPLHEAFEILLFYTDEKPKISKRWIVRIKNVKIESINGELNGRIFTPSCLVSFPNERGMPKFVTSRKKPYDFPEEDKQIFKKLKAFLFNQKSWNVLALPNSYYPDAPNGKDSPHVKLEDITENTIFFSLKCKIVNVKVFLEVKMAYLTVVDNTVCHPPTYQFPKKMNAWSDIVQAEEVYCSQSSKIDILVKNMAHNFDFEAVNLLTETGGFVDISEIQVRKVSLKDNHGLMFMIDMITAKISGTNQLEPASSSVVLPESEESSRPNKNTMEASGYDDVVAEIRSSKAKILETAPDKTRRSKRSIKNKEIKRRKLIPTNTSDTNILADDFLNLTEDENDVNIQNNRMELGDRNDQLCNIEDRLSAKERGEMSKMSGSSSSKSPQKADRDELSALKNIQEDSTSKRVTAMKKVLSVRIPKLTDDEIIELSSNTSVCSEISKRDCRQSNLHQRISSLVGNEKTLVINLTKLNDGEISCSTPNSDSKTRNVDNFSDVSSTTSNQQETRMREELLMAEAYLIKKGLDSAVFNETVKTSRLPHSARFTRVEDEEMDQTNHDTMPFEECSIIESRVSGNTSHSIKGNCSSTNRNKFSSDEGTGSLNQSKSKRDIASRNLFSVKSSNVESGPPCTQNHTDRNETSEDDENQHLVSTLSPPVKRKMSKRNQKNCTKKKTVQFKKSPSSLSSPGVSNFNKSNCNFLGRVLDDDESILENRKTDEDIFNHTPEKSFSDVENAYPECRGESPTKHQNVESQHLDGESRVSPSTTQFSPAESSSLRRTNLDVQNAGAERNGATSPSPSIETEILYTPREQIICTRKSIPRRSTETVLSPPFKPPQPAVNESLHISREKELCTRKRTPHKSRCTKRHLSPSQSTVTEKYNFTAGERKVCTRKSIPHKTVLLQQGSEDENSSCNIEKWLEQVDPNVDIEEYTDAPTIIEPVAEPLLDESQNLPISHNLAEYMTTRDDVNNPCHGRLISDYAVLITSEPSILDEPLDFVSGYCKESCDTFSRYSVLKFNSNSKPICPGCQMEGKAIEVQLVFLFKLHLILHKSRNVCYAALVHAKHASQFLGCTEHQYINDEDLRSKIVKNLSEHFLLKGKLSSVVYSPSLPVKLKVTSGNNDIASGQNSSMEVHLVDTVLPEPNVTSPAIESVF